MFTYNNGGPAVLEQSQFVLNSNRAARAIP